MKTIIFYFDVISPYAWLAFKQLPQALEGISHRVVYKPVLFGAILKHFGQLGPAEITPKRSWTYRHVKWMAKQHDLPLHIPASHPFNSLTLQRLALACCTQGQCNRYVAENLMDYVWCSGLEAADPGRLQSLLDHLKPARPLDDPAVKSELRSNTETAIERGVFGVPTMELDGELFWGLEALPMLRAYILGDPWFSSAEWTHASQRPVSIERKRS